MSVTRGQRLLLVVWALASTGTFLFPKTAYFHSPSGRVYWQGYFPLWAQRSGLIADFKPVRVLTTAEFEKIARAQTWKRALGFLGPDVPLAAKKRILVSEVLFQFAAITIIFGTWFGLSVLRGKRQDRRPDA